MSERNSPAASAAAGLYVVNVCPDCGCQQGGDLHRGMYVTHTAGCPSLGRTFVPEEVDAVAVERLGFNGLMRIAQRLLDEHYPADVPLVCHRDSPDPGARLTAALRDCIEAMAT